MVSEHDTSAPETAQALAAGDRVGMATVAITGLTGVVDSTAQGAGPPVEAGLESRYELGPTLGMGGMAEVRSTFDHRIGRRVAMKITYADEGTLGVERFMREARIQGRLEHPSVVPVYDLDTQPDGRPYFTMKVLHGEDLARILKSLAAGDQRLRSRWGPRRLLSIFADVCQAVAYAHQRGVIHRDIKPANVMVGDFGAVYLLDWGIAKLGGDPDEPVVDALIGDSSESPKTEAGVVLGTPGYMAPEQLRGGPVEAAADIYALGALLFELLYLERLHDGPTTLVRMTTTLDPIEWEERLAAVEREAPPELVAVCQRATAFDPADRYPSATALLGAVQAYLEGDRDLAQREELAGRHVQRARERLADNDRQTAMRELGRAIALRPDDAEAQGLLRTLFVQMPAEPPPEVLGRLRAKELETQRTQAWKSGWLYLLWIAIIPLMMWMGVRQPVVIWGIGLSLVVQSGLAFTFVRRSDPRVLGIAIATHVVIFWLFARVFGPLVMVPVIASLVANGFMFHPWGRWGKAGVVLVGAAGIFVPWLLERWGVLAPSYRFDGQTITILPNALELPPVATEVLLLVVCVSVVVNGSLLCAHMRGVLRSAQLEAHMRAWQLEQLMPAPPR